MKKTDPKTLEQIQKLYDEGYCDEEIAERVGKSKSMIGYWRAKRKLPTVFATRKRLTDSETRQIQDFLASARKYNIIRKQETFIAYEKGLIAFVMRLKHPLIKVSQKDIEDYIIAHNDVDLTRRNELLTTSLVTRFSVPYIPVTRLFDFVSTIIAKRIFNRDGRCVNCGSINPLHLHMLKGKFNLNDENLKTLCENCHKLSNR